MKIYDSKDIQQLLLNKFPLSDVYMSDTTYATASRDWLTGEFYSNFYTWLRQQGISEWKSFNDCDNFSQEFMMFARVCHGLAMFKSNTRNVEGIAVGEMFYTRSSGGHAINVAICNGEVINIEPQNGRVITLSEAECNSCYFIRM